MDGDQATIWQLVSGGLKVLPSKAASAETLVETVWNAYHVFLGTGAGGANVIADKSGTGGGYLNNESGAGGVDVGQPTPSYQIDFGLNPVTSDPRAAAGRGVPDVSATSGGNMGYSVPWPDFEVQDGSETTTTGGTSAGGAAVGGADVADQHDLRRPEAAAARLHERPALHRGGDRAGGLQRRHDRQQHLVLCPRRRLLYGAERREAIRRSR